VENITTTSEEDSKEKHQTMASSQMEEVQFVDLTSSPSTSGEGGLVKRELVDLTASPELNRTGSSALKGKKPRRVVVEEDWSDSDEPEFVTPPVTKRKAPPAEPRAPKKKR
jgi:hypothetical protein